MDHRSLFYILLLSLCVWMHHGVEVEGKTAWNAKIFPNPELHPDHCHVTTSGSDDDDRRRRRPSSSRICDPDGILTRNERASLAETITVLEDTHRVECNSQNDDDDDEELHIQVALALVESMDLYEYQNLEDDDDKKSRAAQDFAMSLHNQWGVGEQSSSSSSCGGDSGVLLFLSINDRAIYISTGGAVKVLLTDYRLDQVMNEMKPLLRQVKYYEALQTAVDAIARHVESGKPNGMERLWGTLSETWPFVIFAAIVLFVIGHGRVERRRQREYARVQTQLSELDRHRAEALKGRYQCTSCPICLNDFEGCSDERNDGQESSVVGEMPTNGSDGLPLKLLRCGHVFDQSCWTEWVERGQGSLSKCPICNQDVGVPHTQDEQNQEESNDPTDQLVDDVRQRGGILLPLQQQQQQQAEQQPRTAAMRRYSQDRMFRLARMSMQFPQFVNHRHVQRWTDPLYDQSLARDSSFTRRNPSSAAQDYTSKYSGGGSVSRRFNSSSSNSRGFGGGSSSGGRGGRW